MDYVRIGTTYHQKTRVDETAYSNDEPLMKL